MLDILTTFDTPAIPSLMMQTCTGEGAQAGIVDAVNVALNSVFAPRCPELKDRIEEMNDQSLTLDDLVPEGNASPPGPSEEIADKDASAPASSEESSGKDGSASTPTDAKVEENEKSAAKGYSYAYLLLLATFLPIW